MRTQVAARFPRLLHAFGAQWRGCLPRLTVTNVNEGPSVSSSATASFAENGSGTVYTATGTDPENNALTWVLGGDDAALFNIDADTGVVTFMTAPNFEAQADAGADNAYDITDTASDGSNSSAAQPAAITVTNVNAATSVNALSASNSEGQAGASWRKSGSVGRQQWRPGLDRRDHARRP
ncbi:hypothetical protein [Sediminicoccus sp. BL-A-41-H5]|uniref:hypothetical protein n=1 Tax=Sediminicoccus sp. BL-A-41-H5 TaxID=3421106 RepID=UPI003D66C3E4